MSGRSRSRSPRRDDRGGSSSSRSFQPHAAKVFIGGLDDKTTKADVEDFLAKAGRLLSVWVARSPPGFAFVEFEDTRDAQDAVRDYDGKMLNGRPVKIEISTGRPKRQGAGAAGGRGSGCYECGGDHFARDCPRRNGGGGGGGGRGRSRSPPRRRSRSRSPRRSSPGRGAGAGRDRSRSPRRERSPPRRERSPPRRDSPRRDGDKDKAADDKPKDRKPSRERSRSR